MFFKKREPVRGLVLRICRATRTARAESLLCDGLIDSPNIPDLDKLEMASTVETVVAGFVIVSGLMQRFVDAGPKLPQQAFVVQALDGLRTAHVEAGLTNAASDKIVEQVLAGLAVAFGSPGTSSVRDIWEKQYNLALPQFRGREDYYVFFAALVAAQNRTLVPIMDHSARGFVPVLV